ncbi:MAG: M24 family metallopeptidase, partial [Anaerolineales bacterium]
MGYRYGIIRDFVGHGVGRSMHESPQIPNFGPANRGDRLRPGMTLAVEVVHIEDQAH